MPPPSLHSAAQELLDALPSVDAASPDAPLVERLRRRLARDVLPRLDAQAPLLLVALAGPNNVGKSTLFNTLAGAPLSPARAEGGLTRQCLAAVHPSGATADPGARPGPPLRAGAGAPRAAWRRSTRPALRGACT